MILHAENKRKVLELYRQTMNVLERSHASTEEGFCTLVTALKTIVENDALPLEARKELRQMVVKAMEEPVAPGSALIRPGMAN